MNMRFAPRPADPSSPLPWGEGQGEGLLFVQTVRRRMQRNFEAGTLARFQINPLHVDPGATVAPESG